MPAQPKPVCGCSLALALTALAALEANRFAVAAVLIWSSIRPVCAPAAAG